MHTSLQSSSSEESEFMSPADCSRRQVKELLVRLLAATWRKWMATQGKKIKGRSVYDVFVHRLKVAGYESSIPKMKEKLNHGLGLQSVPVPPDIIDRLEECKSIALKMIREETDYLTLLAAERSKETRIKKVEFEEVMEEE